MPGATQGAKYSLGELKLPRAAWVSLGPNPFFLMSPVHPGIGLLWMGVCHRRRRGFPYKHLIAKKTVSNLKAKKMKKDNNL